MRITTLIDNIESNGCKAEWGLSFFIEYKGKNILLDTGASSKFIDNANKLDVDLSKVDYGVLSHAHFDHANGLNAFFELNKTAPFYVQKEVAENCYKKILFKMKYIGIKKGTIETHKEKIHFVNGNEKLSEGVSLICHSTANLQKLGLREHMFQKQDGKWEPDNFSHEQSLVFECSEGLVVFNSCSHGGFLNIIDEVSKAFPNKKILAYFGGLHLFNKNKNEIIKVANAIESTGIKHIFTGHCTGEKAFSTLQDMLGNRIEQFSCGATYQFEE